MLLLLFVAVVGCTKSKGGKPYTEDDIIGLMQSSGLTIVERDPIQEDPEFGAQRLSMDDAFLSSVKKAVPATKEYHAQK